VALPNLSWTSFWGSRPIAVLLTANRSHVFNKLIVRLSIESGREPLVFYLSHHGAGFE